MSPLRWLSVCCFVVCGWCAGDSFHQQAQAHLEALHKTLDLLETLHQEISFRRSDLNLLCRKLIQDGQLPPETVSLQTLEPFPSLTLEECTRFSECFQAWGDWKRSRSADGLNCIRHSFRQPCRKVKLRPERSRCFRTSWAWPPGLQLPFCWDESAQKERTRMEIDLIFKIAAIGIIVAVLNQLLIRSGREDQAMMTTLAGLVVVLSILVKQISVLFVTIKSLFAL